MSADCDEPGSPPRRGVSGGLGVAPKQDWKKKKKSSSNNARTMGRFIVVEKSPSKVELNRWGSRKSLSGWDQNSVVLPRKGNHNEESQTSLLSLVGSANDSTEFNSDESFDRNPFAFESTKRQARTAYRGRHPGIITGKPQSITKAFARRGGTAPGVPKSQSLDYGSPFDTELQLRFTQIRIESPEAAEISDSGSIGAYQGREHHEQMQIMANVTARASTAAPIPRGRERMHMTRHRRPRDGGLVQTTGLSRTPPTLGHEKFEHQPRRKRPYTTTRMNSGELVGKAYFGLTRLQRRTGPRDLYRTSHFDNFRRQADERPNRDERERQLDTEMEIRREKEREERSALVNDFKICLASSPFKKPAVLSPRAHNNNTDLYEWDNLANGGVVEDKMLQAGLSGTSVLGGSSVTAGNRFPAGNNAAKQQASTKLYSGQLYRGALMPVNTRWFPEDISQLAVGAPQRRSPRRQQQRQTTVPVGFFSRKKTLAPARVSATNRRHQSPRCAADLVISGDGK